MTDSVLLGLTDNADLVFALTGAIASRDPDTGNPIATTTPLLIRATLKQKTNPPPDALRLQPGNRGAVWLEGKCCSPALLPESLPIDAVASCSIDLPTGGKRTGKFHLYLKTASPALTKLGLTEVAGQKIQGWFDANTI